MIGFPWFDQKWGRPTKNAIPIKSYFLLAPPTFIETSRFWWKPRFWYHGRNHEKHEKWSNRALLYIYIYRIGGKRKKHRFRHHDPHHWNRVPGQKLHLLWGLSRRNAILEWLVRRSWLDLTAKSGVPSFWQRPWRNGWWQMWWGPSLFPWKDPKNHTTILILHDSFLIIRMGLTAQIRPFTCTRHSGRHFL